MDGKQGYVTNTLNQNVMKQEQSAENRLDGSVMQQVSEHQNNMGMGMMDNMGLGIPMMMSSANQQQITSVPMDTSGNSVQTVQAVPGPSSQTTHNQISQSQTSSTQQEEEEESSEDEENSDEECDGDEGLPVKEESEEDPNSRTIEPTTFVNVSLACDEAGPSGLQQQKISDIPEMPMQQPADGDPKSGMSTIAEMSTTRSPARPLFVACHGVPFLDHEGKNQPAIQVKSPPISDDEENNHTAPNDLENNYDDFGDESSPDEDDDTLSDNNDDMYMNGGNYRLLSSKINDTPSSNIVDDDTPSRVGDNGFQEGTDTSVSVVKTVLVPVRDPVTRELKNVLVPVEVKDATGMNIIKSVLVPVEDEDGLMSYQIKKFVVPIKTQPIVPQKKIKPLPSKNAAKSGIKKKGEKKEAKKEVEKEKEAGKDVTEDKKEECKGDSEPKEAAEADTPKEEVDRILDNVKNICPYCQKDFEDEKQVDRHVKRIHKKPFRCRVCYNSFVAKESLKNHMKGHDKDALLECPFCHQKYKCMAGLRYHQIRAHSTIEPKYVCDQCGKRFKLKHDLSSHIERSHLTDTYICRFCGKSVRNIKQHEWYHEKSTKKYEYSFSCHLCPTKFRRRTGLDNHLLMHKNSIKCGQCSKGFMCNSELEDHKISHTDQVTYICKYCRNAYSEKSCLVAHKLLAHGIQQRVPKEFQCNVCSKSFATELGLRKHVTLHSKMFSCTHCDKEFASSHNLKLHIRKHTGERPYECKFCKKSFARSNALRVHRLIHTGERPYVCDLCGQSFTQRSSMMAHRRKHPGSHPPPPPLRLSKLGCNENEF
ncbi:uncharacterized protein LOC143371803 isoform X3 [Andrena cerasifolii]